MSMFQKNRLETLQNLIQEQIGGESLTLEEFEELANSPAYVHVKDKIKLTVTTEYVSGSITGNIDLRSATNLDSLDKKIILAVRKRPGISSKLLKAASGIYGRNTFSYKVRWLIKNNFIRREGASRATSYSPC